MEAKLHKTEQERQLAVVARATSEHQLKMSCHETKRLESENIKLTAQIQKLAQDLEASRNQIHELLQQQSEHKESPSLQQEWQTREQNYKRIIREMKGQLANSDNVVSMDLYRVAATQAKERAAECQIHESAAK